MMIWHFLLKRKNEPSIRMATTEMHRKPVHTLRTAMIHVPFYLRMVVLALIIICMARPQTKTSLRQSETEGIDIIMTMDISTSMLARDILPSRIDAAKMVGCEFIQNRPNDNIGLVLFSGEAFMQCPLTVDHATLLHLLNSASCELPASGIISPGTAIGMGIANSVNHLQNSKAKSKVIILLTDGVDNTGEISPLTAAELALKNNIRIHTISLGRGGVSKQAIAQLPNGELYEAEVENEYDPEILKQIAEKTKGKFYQADSHESLKEIYADIDKLEKNKIKIDNYERKYDAYQIFALLALVLFVVEIIVRYVVLRRIP